MFCKKNILPVFICITLLFPAVLAAEDIKLQKPEGVEMAPSFLLNDIEGNPKGLKDYTGKVVLVHFWATWCIPCKDELPKIKLLRERFKDRGFEVLAIAEDSRKEVKPFIVKYGMEFPVLIDQYGGALRSYRVRGLPASYLVGKSGKIEGIAIGARDWSSSVIMDLIESVLKD